MTNNTCYYGYLSGILTATTLQPLDNIKMTLMLPPNKLTLSSNFAKNIYKVAMYLRIEQGISSFYRGLAVNVWKTGMGSGFYFYALRMMEAMRQRKTVASTFVDSAAARVVSTVLTNPLAIAETRWEGQVFQNMLRMYQREGAAAFFKGCQASCMKQAGFAGIYYSLYEKGKQFGLSSLTSGMISGVISTLSTHPLQIIRTNYQSPQHRHHKSSLTTQLLHLVKQGKLFDGVAPRLVKKPAANTISFLLFEYLQNLQSKNME